MHTMNKDRVAGAANLSVLQYLNCWYICIKLPKPVFGFALQDIDISLNGFEFRGQDVPHE